MTITALAPSGGQKPRTSTKWRLFGPQSPGSLWCLCRDGAARERRRRVQAHLCYLSRHMANDPFSPKKRFSAGRVFTGLVLIFSATFVVAYYAPLTDAHSALAKEHESLSGAQRNVSTQLKLTTSQLEAAQKERDGLHEKLTGIEKQKEAEKAKFRGLFDGLAEKLKKRVGRKQLQLSQEGPKTVLLIDDLMLFRAHEVTVHRPGRAVVCDVARAVKGQDLRLEVVAHSASERIDNPILAGEFSSTWGLTASRAVGVVQMLIKCGVKPETISATGAAHHRPLEGLLKNSTGQVRVVISEE